MVKDAVAYREVSGLAVALVLNSFSLLCLLVDRSLVSMRALLALAFFIAPAAAFLGPALSQSAPRMAVRKEPLRMSVATPPTVSVETLIVAMGDDTRLKIRLAPDTFKELVKCSNAVRGAWISCTVEA